MIFSVFDRIYSYIPGLQIIARAMDDLVFLLRDEFTTDQSAPITSPRTCEPGPGTLTVTDASNVISISSGNLVYNGVAAAASGLVSGNYSRVAGKCLVLYLNSVTASPGSQSFFGIAENTTHGNSGWVAGLALAASGTNHNVAVNSNALVGITLSGSPTNAKLYFIVRSAGGFVVIDNTLQYVSNQLTSSLYDKVSGGASALTRTFSVGYWRRAQLSAPWDSDYGIATNRVASPSVGETTTSEANALVEMTWTAVTGQVWELSTRRTDDDNRWIVRCDQAGSTIKLIERNAGVETERSSAAQTWTNGTVYRLVVVQDGNTIRTYVANSAKNTYASATFNNTAAGVKTDRAGTDLVAWPRTLSGAALAELQKWTA